MIPGVSRLRAAVLLFVPSLVFAFSGGSGTPGDPFQIATAAQLDSLRYYLGIDDSGKYFKLMNDIDLTTWLSPGNPGYNGGAFWMPVGGLVGLNSSGTVSGSYASGSVSGGDNVGGLAGMNSYQGAVNNCYASGTVSGSIACGGLVGLNTMWGTVKECYASGAVSGKYRAGGLIGWDTNGVVTGGFWDRQTTHQDTSDGSTPAYGKTTAEMRTQSTFTGWNFASAWAIASDKNNGYPYLRWQTFSGIAALANHQSDRPIGFKVSNSTISVTGIGRYDHVSIYSVSGRCLKKVQGTALVDVCGIGPQPLLIVVNRGNQTVSRGIVRLP